MQLALAYHFDAVVIGSKLRDGNGIELLRGLGGRLPGTPIIFVVPLGGEEAALQAMESGAQSYIVKTPRYNELLPAIVEEHVVEARNRKRLVETEQIQAQAVTARKTVEEQLSQSQARLKLVLEQAFLLALGEAAGHHDGADAALALEVEHLADDAEGLLAGRLDEAAGVDDDHVGAVGVG